MTEFQCRKVELASSFVKTRVSEEANGADQDYQPVKLSRLIVFLNDWIQSLMISSEKKMRGDRQKPQAEVVEACLDFRCWEIFLFCLEESFKFEVLTEPFTVYFFYRKKCSISC